MSTAGATRGIPASRRWFGLLGATVIVLGCSTSPGATGSSPQASAPASVTGSLAPASGGPSLEPSPGASATATDAPGPTGASTPGPTPHLNAGFQYSDVVKVQVDRLAVRRAPRRGAALLREYNVLAAPPANLGEVRLSSGDFVSVHLGPLPIGDTVWYLVWEAKNGNLHQSDNGWYDEPPFDGTMGPGWSAASVGSAQYMTLERHPSLEEIESFLPLGVNAAGQGDWESAPQPRHDGFLMDWAAAAPTAGTPCDFTVFLVPADGDAEPHVALAKTTTDGVKIAPVTGVLVHAPWLPVPAGSWTEFTVAVESTCNWAVRLSPLHHD